MEYNIDDLILRDETDVQFFEIKFSTVSFGDDESEVYQLFGSKKIVLGKILNGKKIGLWVNWYENGQKKSTKTFVDGVLYGEHSYWYEDGKLEKICNHCGTGVVKLWYENGQIKKDGFYEEGLLNGVCEYYYENGNLKERSIFKKGEYFGLVEKYYENDNLKTRFTKTEGKLIGDYESYYETGLLKKRCFYKGGEVEGLFEEYYENGNLKLKCFYENAIFHGSYESFYKNGKSNRIGRVYKEKFSGVIHSYYPNWVLKESLNYTENRCEGSYEKYYESGKLKEDGINKNGIRKGYQTYNSNYKEVKVYSFDDSHTVYLKYFHDTYEAELDETESYSYIVCLEEKIDNIRVNWFIKIDDIEAYYQNNSVIYLNEIFKNYSIIEYNGIKIYFKEYGSIRQFKKIELSYEIIESFELVDDTIGVIIYGREGLELHFYDFKLVRRSEVGNIHSELESIDLDYYEMLDDRIYIPYISRVRYLRYNDLQGDFILEELISENGRITESIEFSLNGIDKIGSLKQGLEDYIGSHQIYVDEDDDIDESHTAIDGLLS
mgnify:CR=1 FL=1